MWYIFLFIKSNCFVIKYVLSFNVGRIKRREITILKRRNIMSNGNKPTEDQHFIPRMYLKGFSEVKKKGKKEKAFIYEFNINSMIQIPGQVNIKNICVKKNLYEIFGADGSIIAQNRIEKIFQRIETETIRVIESIKKKSQNENCLACSYILSEDDKSYLNIFIASLMYRDPQTINTGIKFLQDTNPSMSNVEARNFTIMNLLPFGVDDEWDKNTIIRTAVADISGMSFQIGIADNDVIFTSDRPVIKTEPSKDELYNRPKAVIIPLTSKLVLFLFSTDNVEAIKASSFFKLSTEQIVSVQTYIAKFAREWIYSRYPLTPEQLEIIKKVRD